VPKNKLLTSDSSRNSTRTGLLEGSPAPAIRVRDGNGLLTAPLESDNLVIVAGSSGCSPCRSALRWLTLNFGMQIVPASWMGYKVDKSDPYCQNAV
jgi:hypothetical protein